MSNVVAKPEIRRLSDCSFADAVKIWNEGFQGYFVDMTVSLDQYLSRLQRDALSPDLSLVAFCNGKPAGFLLNAIGTSAGRKIAWNGGTGVAPQFRARGVGKVLMRATIDLYQEQEIELATLEAISENEPAISLYRQFGYEIVDQLIFLNHEGKLSEHAFRQTNSDAFSATQVRPDAVAELEFYQELVPWQARWQNVMHQNGEALIVSNADGIAAGYALYKKKYDKQGRTADIALYQCVAVPGDEIAAVVGCALRTLYTPFDLECTRSTYNFPESNEVVHSMLIDAGFTSFIEQVHMVRMFP